MGDIQFPSGIRWRTCPSEICTSDRDLPRWEEQSFLARGSKVGSNVSSKCLNSLVNEETITVPQLAGFGAARGSVERKCIPRVSCGHTTDYPILSLLVANVGPPGRQRYAHRLDMRTKHKSISVHLCYGSSKDGAYVCRIGGNRRAKFEMRHGEWAASNLQFDV